MIERGSNMERGNKRNERKKQRKYGEGQGKRERALEKEIGKRGRYRIIESKIEKPLVSP